LAPGLARLLAQLRRDLFVLTAARDDVLNKPRRQTQFGRNLPQALTRAVPSEDCFDLCVRDDARPALDASHDCILIAIGRIARALPAHRSAGVKDRRPPQVASAFALVLDAENG